MWTCYNSTMDSEIILFEANDKSVSIPVKVDSETVWLNRNQMSELFGRDVKTIGKHINNALKEELEASTVAKFAIVQNEGSRQVRRDVEYYNLDVIISVGYRVKSQRGVEFRQWANKVLKQYILQGYALNEKRLEYLNKTVEIESKIIAHMAEIDADEMLSVVNGYTNALDLLDDYDHQCVQKPEGNHTFTRLETAECFKIIEGMKFGSSSSLFGTEKESGKLEGILSAVYQSVFGEEVYPSLEEKAANLLYLLVKDHPFNDGCKRIAATLFLTFLQKNGALKRADGRPAISNGTLVAITLLIAESKPEEKPIMISVVMNILGIN